MEPSPIAVEASAHSPEFPLKGKTALVEAIEDVLCGSVSLAVQKFPRY
jgi:ornithine carrier protein